MTMLVSSLATLPKPEGAPPFVVSSEIFLRIAYPVSRDFTVDLESIEQLGQSTTDSIQAFFKPEWRYRAFEREWLYAICESGASGGYQVTYHERDLQNHPFAILGLAPKNVFELIDSSWLIDRQATVSSLAAQYSARPPELKHYIFAFDDVVFECATTHFTTEYVFGKSYDVSAYVARSLKWWQ